MSWRPFSCKMDGGNCASLERIFSVSLSSQRLLARQNARTKAATRLAGKGLEQSSLLHRLVLGGVLAPGGPWLLVGMALMLALASATVMMAMSNRHHMST